MESRLLEKITLPNGLLLELLDQTRPMAGDRWLVSLLARIEIPLLPELFSDLKNGQQVYQELFSSFGEHLVFTQEKMRHFVDTREVEDTLTGLTRRFKENLISYLGSPKFPYLYALKRYSDLRESNRPSTNRA
jgi:hypothetical protein